MLGGQTTNASRGAYEVLRDAAPVFAALGDPTRLRLVVSLSDGRARSIRELTDATDVTRQAVTKHLHTLSSAGLVRDAKEGRERLWQLEPDRFARATAALEMLGRQWDTALGRLKRTLEDGRGDREGR